jgi:hypothetical protein
MGISLCPLISSEETLEYNWGAWSFLVGRLSAWGIDTREFSDRNHGEIISSGTCLAVADAIETHLSELSKENQLWLGEHVDAWRRSGGFEQQ